MSSDRDYQLRWHSSRVSKLMRRNKIQNRSHLASVTKLGASTIYAAFDADWAGIATTTVLAALACTFGAKLDSLVLHPGTDVREAGIRS